MKIINCPKCKTVLEINISNAVDELGEVYQCPNCNWKFRYVEE